MKNIKISILNKKVIIIGVLLLLSLIPLNIIKFLINDRYMYQKSAIYSVVEPMGGSAKIEGAFIAVPYKSYNEKIDDKGVKTKEEKIEYIMFAPEDYDLNMNVDTYYLYRGIFKVPVYDAKIKISAKFNNFDFSKSGISENDIIKNEGMLLIGVSNKRSVISTPKLTINNIDLGISDFVYSSPLSLSNKLCYALKNINYNNELNLNGEIELQGGNSLSITPIAWNNKICVVSNWKSPGFNGGFLPSYREINKNGFIAKWDISGINIGYSKTWLENTSHSFDSFNIDLVNHINNYSLIERCVKYAFLFLIIPFLTIFTFEITKKKKIHPIQYILIGAVDIVFYLLLISTSEYINFNLAYLICILLIIIISFIYVSSILKSWKCGYILCIIQIISYLFLYGTLQSEDYALLIGSIGLFVAIVVFMFVTRKIDWYHLDELDNNNIV